MRLVDSKHEQHVVQQCTALPSCVCVFPDCHQTYQIRAVAHMQLCPACVYRSVTHRSCSQQVWEQEHVVMFVIVLGRLGAIP